MDTIVQLNAALAGRYEVSREIGAGGMATVYLARDLRHDRHVAIKVLRQDLALALGGARFLREIQIAAQLHHPHILPVFDSGDAGGLLWYSMPFVEGESLRDRIVRDGALPIAGAVTIVREVADALGKAHAAGVVHRDIKPENVMIADGHALVADFGVAKAVNEAGKSNTGLTSAGMSLGTPAYMAPEQVAADPAADHRVDIYSLGVMAYELVAGKAPFSHLPPAQQLAAHIATVPDPIESKRPDCPPALAEAITRCLAKTPGDRPQSAAELRTLLDGASGAWTTTRAVAGSPPPRSMKRQVMLGLVMAVLVTAIGFFGRRITGGGAGAPAEGPALAVLPFENLQGDSASGYFSDGISEEILAAASRLRGLRVLGRSVSFRYRGGTVDAKQIGSELSVSHVLEGSVRQASGRVRVNVRLTDAKSGFSVWSERYDRDLTDIFAVEDAIAQEIAGALNVQLVAGAATTKQATTSVEAHDQYLLGLAARNSRDVKKAAGHFSRAIALDSSYAAAHAALASVVVIFPEYDLRANADSALAASRAAARRALALDSTQVHAHLALAYGNKTRGRDFARADAEYARALAIDPNMAEANHWRGELLMELGRYEDARAQFVKSLGQDSGAPATHAMLATVLFRLAAAGQPGLADSAMAECRRSTEMSPPGGVFPFEFACGSALSRIKRFDIARPHLATAGRAIGDSTFFTTMMDGVADPSKRGAAVGRIHAAAGRSIDPVIAAVWYLLLSEPDRALDALEQAERTGSLFLSYLEVLDFSAMPDSPRFKALRAKLGYTAK